MGIRWLCILLGLHGGNDCEASSIDAAFVTLCFKIRLFFLFAEEKIVACDMTKFIHQFLPKHLSNILLVLDQLRFLEIGAINLKLREKLMKQVISQKSGGMHCLSRTRVMSESSGNNQNCLSNEEKRILTGKYNFTKLERGSIHGTKRRRYVEHFHCTLIHRRYRRFNET